MKQKIRFIDLSPPVRAIWAKSGTTSGLPLLIHMFDVAAVAESILYRESPSYLGNVSKALGIKSSNIPRSIACLVGKHDIGKAVPGFQAKWPEGKSIDTDSGLEFPTLSLKASRHDCATQKILQKGELSPEVSLNWIQHISQAISAHHGYHLRSTDVMMGVARSEPKSWKKTRQELLAAYESVLHSDSLIVGDSLSLAYVEWLAGLTSVADWIGSNVTWFALDRRCDDLEECYQHSLQIASQALDEIDWQSFSILHTNTQSDARSLMPFVIGKNESINPRPLQIVGTEMLQKSEAPSLMIIEAPMGEGKTELAFLATLILQKKFQHRGFYFALPTQATSNAILERASVFVDLCSKGLKHHVNLVHGGAYRQMILSKLRIGNETGDNQEGTHSASWFSQSKRALLTAYGVGTIDQALFSILNVKHHFVRLWGLANKVVILDEVHAYDAYTGGLIQNLLLWLKSLNCSVILMSATLPAEKRRKFLTCWNGECSDIPEVDYPRITVADTRSVKAIGQIATRETAVVAINAVTENVDDIVKKAIDLVIDGGCGAVIVNTVDRAQSVYLGLKQRVNESVVLKLFHARFPMNERHLREKDVLATFGKDGKRPERCVLVATQVVEQSLDIDFDFMITDLAPIDLLMQRAGRLHRHQRENRPMRHQKPVLTIAGLSSEKLPNMQETSWKYVYEPYYLARTWLFLKGMSEFHFPQDIDRIVQLVYGNAPLPDGFESDLLQYVEQTTLGEHLAYMQDRQQRAENIAIDPSSEPSVAYDMHPRNEELGEGDGNNLKNCTRLGAMGMTVIPLFETDFGLSTCVAGTTIDLKKPFEDYTAEKLYQRQLNVSHQQLIKQVLKTAPIKSISDCPLLNGMYPLVFGKNSKLVLTPSETVELSEELGLRFLRKSQGTEETAND